MIKQCANRHFGKNPGCLKQFVTKPGSGQECCSRTCAMQKRRRREALYKRLRDPNE